MAVVVSASMSQGSVDRILPKVPRMAAKRKKRKAPPEVPALRPNTTRPNQAVSLDQLTAAFAELLHPGEQLDDPNQLENDQQQSDDSDERSSRLLPQPSQAAGETDAEWGEGEAIAIESELSVQGIVESMLFVGHPRNLPLSAERIASLIRGVTPEEVGSVIRRLNEIYQSIAAAYHIETVEGGYRLALREELNSIRQKFYGRLRQVKLSQAAIEVLALVAYNEPLTAEEIKNARGTESLSILNQLVRRQLLRVERDDEKPRVTRFSTTKRLLEVFGLDSLADLPQAVDLE